MIWHNFLAILLITTFQFDVYSGAMYQYDQNNDRFPVPEYLKSKINPGRQGSLRQAQCRPMPCLNKAKARGPWLPQGRGLEFGNRAFTISISIQLKNSKKTKTACWN